jgi:hypothetical protein
LQARYAREISCYERSGLRQPLGRPQGQVSGPSLRAKSDFSKLRELLRQQADRVSGPDDADRLASIGEETQRDVAVFARRLIEHPVLSSRDHRRSVKLQRATPAQGGFRRDPIGVGVDRLVRLRAALFLRRGRTPDKLNAAVAAVLASGLRTADIKSEGAAAASTTQMGDAILRECRRCTRERGIHLVVPALSRDL